MFPCITLSFLTRNKACQSLSSTILTFTWTSRGFAEGNYTISAYAEPVPGETDTADNTFIDGSVRVSVPGDIDGDGSVSPLYLGLMGPAWGFPIDLQVLNEAPLPFQFYVFNYWDVDGASQGVDVKTIIVPMGTPHTATAHYKAIPVGGIWTPTNKLKLLAPYILSTSVILTFYIVVVVHVKHWEKSKNSRSKLPKK